MSKERGTRERKKRFVKEYQKDLNGQKAAERAGYAPSTARAKASHLLKDPEIKNQIDESLIAKLEAIDVNSMRVLKELAAIAFFDIGKIFDEEGQLLKPKEMEEETRRAVQSIEISEDYTEGVNTGRTTRIKPNDKLKALEMFMKFYKLLTDRVEHSGTVSLEALVAGSQEDES